MSQVGGLPNNSYKPITNTTRVRARVCKLQKECTRLTAASDKAYQLLAHGRWFSPASSTTKTGRHDIAGILLKVALNTINQIKSNLVTYWNVYLYIAEITKYDKQPNQCLIYLQVRQVNAYGLKIQGSSGQSVNYIFNTVIGLSHLCCHNVLYFLNNPSVIILSQLHFISEYCRILNTPHSSSSPLLKLIKHTSIFLQS